MTIQEQQHELSSKGFDVRELLNNVAEVNYGKRIFKRFRALTNPTG